MRHSPPFGPKSFVCHHFAAVSAWVEHCQTLLKTQGRIGYRGYDNTPILDGNAHTLIGMQTGSAGHRRRKTDTQIVTPLLDVENRFGHNKTPVYTKFKPSILICQHSMGSDSMDLMDFELL